MAGPREQFRHERRLLEQGIARIAGVDEAGRGPLAGPVVAAAVIFPAAVVRRRLPPALADLNDSKQCTPAGRERLFHALETLPDIELATALIEPEEIDRLNILRATHRAMELAVGRLQPPPGHLLVDGLPALIPGISQTALVQGDARSFSIAAASIVAKVTRDRLMIEYHARFPGYGFHRHKGYPTREHLEALDRLGPCPIHRRSFTPVRQRQPELF